LVSNSSFEIYENCPNYTTDKSVKELIPGWFLPTRGTSDYFNSCSRFQVNVPNNFIGHMYAKDGQAYAGIILIEKPTQDTTKRKILNYREYLQTELYEPLLQGKSYKVKFHYAIATYSTYAANNIGIHISKEKIEQRRSTKVLKYSPQIKADTNFINTTRDVWFEYSDTLLAKGEEKYLTIGNFYDDKNTHHLTLDLSEIRKSLRKVIAQQKIAYYYIDMISVIMIKEITSPEEKTK
jgi:hypothetical protein